MMLAECNPDCQLETTSTCRQTSTGNHKLIYCERGRCCDCDDGSSRNLRDLIVYPKQRGLFRIFESNPMYDSLMHPLLFPMGEHGCTYGEKYANGTKRHNQDTMSLREHIAFRLFPDPEDGSVLHDGGCAYQQWCVDQRSKVEQEALRWCHNNQETLRADLYAGGAYRSELPDVVEETEFRVSEYNQSTGRLDDHVAGGRLPLYFLDHVGKLVILPSNYTGGPRQMYKSYQDSLALVREFGKPDIFLTMTCNPEWKEIRDQIAEHQKPPDGTDIVARVWNQNLRAFLHDVDEGKRGLPHAHILIILAEEDKPRTRDLINKLVSCEILDEATNLELNETLMNCMMHGPCGSQNPNCVCMVDGKYSKGYPKPLVEVTHANVDKYAEV
ncbi:LOW QUALITY PROTEIN: Helitron helicase [Phytophthora megakarya]|uniref:Helitron helicase n=1 Tax=Phytophthora megakarya TaxID=4795 RepID=A0A225UZG1_9STRA|nr:LOW QUALITY PROTEIN: Helitron helicase [Phytophthora megakarya]